MYFLKSCILFYHVTHSFSYLILTEYMEKHQGIIEGCRNIKLHDLLFSELSAHVSVISDALTNQQSIWQKKKLIRFYITHLLISSPHHLVFFLKIELLTIHIKEFYNTRSDTLVSHEYMNVFVVLSAGILMNKFCFI